MTVARHCRRTPGSHPDTYAERLRGHGTPGACGQFVLHDQPLVTIADPRDTSLYGTGLDMLWVAGDGNRPTIWNGAALAPGAPDPLTLVGVPTAEVAPYQLAAGTDVACERHSGASDRISIVPRDPAAGLDAIMIAFGRWPLAGWTGRYLSTRSGATGQGVEIYSLDETRLQTYVRTAGGVFSSSTSPVGAVAPGAVFFGATLLNRVADTITIWTPAGAGAAAAFADGAIVGGGIGIAARPSAANILEAGGGIIAVAYLIGAGLAASWAAGAYAKCMELRRRLTGLTAVAGADPTFVRATAGSRLDRNGRLWIYSSGLARAGDSERLLVEPTRINKCYRNTGIPVGALAEQIGDDASTATGVADAASLALVGLADLGPNVCNYVNASGATRYIRCGAATGATTRHALSVYADVWGGGASRIGWWDTAGPGWTDVGSAGDNYVRVVYPDLVPPSATCVACLAIPNGGNLAWIGEQNEGSGSANECTVTSVIPNTATAATAQRNADSLTSVTVPPNGGGSVELVVEPQGWGGAGNTVATLYNTGSGSAVLWGDTAGTWRCLIDGTTTLDSGVAPVDGTAHHIRLRWVQGVGMSIEVRLASTMALLGRVDGAYDGTLLGAGGTWQLAGGPVAVSGLRAYRNGGG